MLNDHLDRLDKLGQVARHLPFSLDDYDAVNQTFAQWMHFGTERDRHAIDLWLYCAAQRYVLLRIARDHQAAAGEADRIVEYVFMRAYTQLDRVTDPERFTHWASVVFRNSYLNGLRNRFTRTSLEESTLFADEEDIPDTSMADLDRALVRHTVEQAIERLPNALKIVAQLRLLESRSYQHIAAITEHELPTVRTYAAKALKRLREDPAIQILGRVFERAPMLRARRNLHGALGSALIPQENGHER